MAVEPHWQEVMWAQWASMLCLTLVTRAASRAGRCNPVESAEGITSTGGENAQWLR